MKLLVLLGLCLPELLVSAQNDYCDITPQHTMCRYGGVGPACKQPISRDTSQAEKQEILDYHNRLRSRVATGSTGQPPASNMNQLVWDHELAAVAQRLADQCKFNHDCADCRKVRRFSVGQNLYQSFNSRRGKNSWRKAIDSWFNEIDRFPASSVGFYAFSSETGHYSQMVWAETTRVGCGVTAYENGRFTSRLYVCNYGKGGNFLRKPVYKIGAACSACPGSTTCSDSYPGLCIGRNTAGAPVSPARPPTSKPERPSGPPPRPSRPCFGFFCFISNRPFKPVSMVGDVAMMGVNTAVSGVNSAANGVTNFVSSGTNIFTNGINTVSRPVASGISNGLTTGVSLTNSGVNFLSRPAIQAANSGVNFVSRPFRFPSRSFLGGK